MLVLTKVGLIIAIFVLVLWGRIGFDSESVIQCQHAERCGEALKYLVANNN